MPKLKYLKGKQIVIVAEGDAGFYSSIQYVYDKFEEARNHLDRNRRNSGIYSGRCLGRDTYRKTRGAN